MIHPVEHGKWPHGRPVAPEFIGMDDLWDVIHIEQSAEDDPGSLGVPVRLEPDVEHGAVLEDGPP